MFLGKCRELHLLSDVKRLLQQKTYQSQNSKKWAENESSLTIDSAYLKHSELSFYLHDLREGGGKLYKIIKEVFGSLYCYC